jgi:plasmid maintenance system antidote protein VapI
MSDAKHWYRVTFSGDNVLSVVAVEASETEETHVIYIEASDPKEAQRLASKIAWKRRRLRLVAQGRCNCGRELPPSTGISKRTGKAKTSCLLCQNRAQRTHQTNVKAATVLGVSNEEYLRLRRSPDSSDRDNAKRALNQVRASSTANRKRDMRTMHRLEALLEVRQAWQLAKNISEFTDWLKEQILAAESGKEIEPAPDDQAILKAIAEDTERKEAAMGSQKLTVRDLEYIRKNTHLSARRLAADIGVGHSVVTRILRLSGLAATNAGHWTPAHKSDSARPEC